jgi:hypothetical protein
MKFKKMTLSCSCLCLLRRLEKVLATEVMAKQRWKAIRLKQKFDRNRSQSTATTLECKRFFKGIVQRILRGVNNKLKYSEQLNWRPARFSF